MINILQSPPPLALSGNPVDFYMQASPVTSPGAYAVMSFNFGTGQAITHNDNLTIEWQGKSITITFKDTPDTSGLQYVTTSSITTGWYMNLIDLIKRNYLLSQDFRQLATPTVFRALRMGAEYTPTFNSDISADAIACTITAGVTPGYKSGHQYIGQVFMSNKIIGEDAVSPNSDGQAVMDIAEYLDTELERARKTNTFLFTSVTGVVTNKNRTHSNFVKTYFLRYGEKYSGLVRKMADTFTFRIMQGGLDLFKILKLRNNGMDFTEWLTSGKKFLTWSPKEKITTLQANERLYHIRTGAGNLTVNVKDYYNDGTTATATLATITEATLYRLHEIICSFKHRAAQVKTVEKYDIWITNAASTIVSEIKTFVVNRTHRPARLQFIFRNSFAVFDTIEANGVNKHSATISRSEFTDQEGFISVLENLKTSTIEANTGAISREMMEWLDELLLSNEVYLNVAGQWTPVIITATSKTPVDDNQRRFSLIFTIKLAGENKFYSQLTTASGGGSGISIDL